MTQHLIILHVSADWLVQFKFCSKLPNARECDKEKEIAVTMKTEADGWNVRLDTLNCWCSDDIYYIKGWSKHNGAWIYEYVCDLVSWKSILPGTGTISAITPWHSMTLEIRHSIYTYFMVKYKEPELSPVRELFLVNRYRDGFTVLIDIMSFNQLYSL